MATAQGACRKGLERTLKALVAEGRLSDADEADVALARSLADAVDGDPANAALWREYRAAVATVKAAGLDGASDDDSAWLVHVRAPLGHTP